MLTTTTGAAILTPAEVNESLIRPLTEHLSVFAQVATVLFTSAHTLRVPVQSQTPTAAWVPEGSELPVSDANLSELAITPTKLAGLSVVTSELAADSSPAAADIVGNGLAKDIALKLDLAAFRNLGGAAPVGLSGTSGVQTVTAGAAFTHEDATLDSFNTAIQLSAEVGGQITAFVTSPAIATQLGNMKVDSVTGTRTPLLQPDPTLPTRPLIFGVPLLVSPAVLPNTVWSIPKASSLLVIRENMSVIADKSVYFTSDRVAIRATVRAGIGFPEPSKVVKIVVPT